MAVPGTEFSFSLFYNTDCIFKILFICNSALFEDDFENFLLIIIQNHETSRIT